MNHRLFRIIYITLFIIFITHAPASAQDKKITYVEEGMSVPFSGVLLTPEAFSELKINSDLKQEEIDIRVKYQVKSALLDKQLEIDNLNTKLTWQQKEYEERIILKDEQIDSLYDDLEKATKKTLWDHLKGPANFVGGVGLSIAIFYIHSQLVDVSYGQ